MRGSSICQSKTTNQGSKMEVDNNLDSSKRSTSNQHNDVVRYSEQGWICWGTNSFMVILQVGAKELRFNQEKTCKHSLQSMSRGCPDCGLDIKIQA